MADDRRDKALLLIEQARQTQEMAAKYPIYLDDIAWIDGKIKWLDEHWHLVVLNNDALQQYCGQKQVLVEVKQHFDDRLKMDIAAKLAKIDEGEDDET